MVAKAKARGKKKDTQDNTIPPDLASRWETIVEEAAKRIFIKRKAMAKAIGQRPYRGLPVEASDLTARWAQIRHDTPALVEVLSENAKFKKDGKVFVPKALIESMTTTEDSFRKGGLD
jgi:hypothetical protein